MVGAAMDGARELQAAAGFASGSWVPVESQPAVSASDTAAAAAAAGVTTVTTAEDKAAVAVVAHNAGRRKIEGY